MQLGFGHLPISAQVCFRNEGTFPFPPRPDGMTDADEALNGEGSDGQRRRIDGEVGQVGEELAADSSEGVLRG